MRAAPLVALLLLSCGGTDWVHSRERRRELTDNGEWEEQNPSQGVGPSRRPADAGQTTRLGQPYRNTYYDFPSEKGGDTKATVYDGQCAPIAQVSQAFHDAVCLQGSGRLATGETISFNRRDCECAAVCPKSGSKICFDKLDPKEFPTGRGASGRPVTPLRSVAVDTEIIPLGTPIRIEEFIGLRLPNGTKHDGCFRADDRGKAVTGRHVDIFAGDPDSTKVYNQLVPSNEGVMVEIDPEPCKYLAVPK